MDFYPTIQQLYVWAGPSDMKPVPGSTASVLDSEIINRVRMEPVRNYRPPTSVCFFRSEHHAVVLHRVSGGTNTRGDVCHALIGPGGMTASDALLLEEGFPWATDALTQLPSLDPDDIGPMLKGAAADLDGSLRDADRQIIIGLLDGWMSNPQAEFLVVHPNADERALPIIRVVTAILDSFRENLYHKDRYDAFSTWEPNYSPKPYLPGIIFAPAIESSSVFRSRRIVAGAGTAFDFTDAAARLFDLWQRSPRDCAKLKQFLKKAGLTTGPLNRRLIELRNLKPSPPEPPPATERDLLRRATVKALDHQFPQSREAYDYILAQLPPNKLASFDIDAGVADGLHDVLWPDTIGPESSAGEWSHRAKTLIRYIYVGEDPDAGLGPLPLEMDRGPRLPEMDPGPRPPDVGPGPRLPAPPVAPVKPKRLQFFIIGVACCAIVNSLLIWALSR